VYRPRYPPPASARMRIGSPVLAATALPRCCLHVGSSGPDTGFNVGVDVSRRLT
jgi:hypothetical protein